MTNIPDLIDWSEETIGFRLFVEAGADPAPSRLPAVVPMNG